MRRFLRWAADPVELLGAWIATISLVIMVMTAFAQVIFRYLLSSPIGWAEELIRYAAVWMTFIGASVALRRGELVAVEFLTSRLAGLSKRISFILAHACVICFMIVLIKNGFDLFRFALETQQKTPALQLPIAYAYLSLPVGGIAMLVQELVVCFDPEAAASAPAID